MIPILGNLRARAWQLGTIASLSVVVGLGIMLAVTKIDNGHLITLNQKLDTRINDPRVGLVVQLAQVRTNEATLTDALAQQNKAYAKLSADSAERLAQLTAQLKIAQADRARVEKQVATFLAVKPQGSTLEARIIDVDTRLLEMLQ